MKGFLVSLLVVVGLLVAGDVVARNFASERVAEEVRANLALEREPDVEVAGFPFVTQLARGRLERVTVSLDDISRGGLTLSSLSVSLDEVRFSVADLLDQNMNRLRTDAVAGQAELDEVDLNAALDSAGAPFQARFDQGEVFAVPSQAAIEPRIEGGRLLLAVPGLGETALALPHPIEGITYESVEVFPGRLVLRFGSGPMVLRAPG